MHKDGKPHFYTDIISQRRSTLAVAAMADNVSGPYLELDAPTVVGEGPIYRFSDNTLHFNDLCSNKVFILPIDASTGTATASSISVLNTSDAVTAQYLRKDHPGSYICLYHQGIGYLDEKTGSLTVIKEIIPNSERSLRRFNDGAVDPSGRLWGGEIDFSAESLGVGNVKSKPIGRLWRYDPDGSLHQMDDGLSVSNGIGWSPDLKIMYLNDSVLQKTYAFDYDDKSGSISNKRVLKDYEGEKDQPDGLVVDVKGNIWVAMWQGYRALVLNPAGEIIKKISFPAKNITCPAWGGINNDTIFFTTGTSEGDTHGGHLFMYKTDTKGMPTYEFSG